MIITPTTYQKPYYLWSDKRQAAPLTDMQAAYYGYSVINSSVWVSGVVGLGVGGFRWSR